jgi:patatin-like phospholipase/acyl hydrolase
MLIETARASIKINQRPNSFQILSLDGGGIKGLFSAAVLAKWEEDLACVLTDHFDLIVGTSTGGIVALGLGLGLRPREIVQFYLGQGDKIFPNGWTSLYRTARQFVRSKFSPTPLRIALQNCFGEKLLGHSTKRLAIPSYDLGQGDVRVFKTAHHERLRRDFKLPAWKIALATSAAPTFFPAFREIEERRLIDGGVWANNPVMLATVEAMAVLKVPRENISALSLGTTAPVKRRHDRLDTGGLWQWKADAADVIMCSQCIAATAQATLLLGPDKLLRVNAKVPEAVFSLDKLTADKLIAAASHQSLHTAPEIQRRFLNHQAPDFVPYHPV